MTVAIECIVSVSRERLSYDAHLFIFYKYLLQIKQSSPLKVKKVHICSQPTPPKTCESVDCKKAHSTDFDPSQAGGNIGKIVQKE